MIRAALVVLACAGTASAEDFVSLTFGDATFGFAAADVMTAARHEGPTLMILFQDRLIDDYGPFTNRRVGQTGTVRICGEVVGTLHLKASAYYASMLVEGMSEESVAHWVSVVKSRSCQTALVS